MKIEDLLKKLEIEKISDMDYAESFCGLMELEEEIEEDLFFRMFSEMTIDTLKEISDNYLGEVVSSVPDDCIEFYQLVSSYKRSFRGLINYSIEENRISPIISELYRFREWYQDPENVLCSDLIENSDVRISVCESLILSRMERLSMGSYSFNFDSAMELEYDEYEEYMDKGDFEDIDEYEEGDSEMTLIDKDNPVIDGEDYYKEKVEYLQ